MKPHEIVNLWAQKAHVRFVSRSHGQATTDTVSHADLQDLVCAAVEADRAQRVPDGRVAGTLQHLRDVVREYRQMHNWRLRHECEAPEPGAERKEKVHRIALALAMNEAEKFLSMLALTPAPAQQERKPMTREQVKGLMKTVGYEAATPQEKADFINGVRYAERHHGIFAEPAQGIKE